MPILFCQSEPQPTTIEQLLQPCQQHNKKIEFVCTARSCEQAPLLCNKCIKDHKDHTWSPLQDFFDQEMINMMSGGDSKTKKELEIIKEKITIEIEQMIRKIQRRAEKVKRIFSQSICELETNYSMKSSYLSRGVRLNNENMNEIYGLYCKEKQNSDWVILMDEYLQKMTKDVGQSSIKMIDDLQKVMNAKVWFKKDKEVFQQAYRKFQTHLHKHAKVDQEYFKFSEQAKHLNIRLSQDCMEATYLKAMPSKPVAIANRNLTSVHNKFAFEIIKLDSKAIFFSSTTIFIGICNPTYVKAGGLRKINQPSKGAYLIGSTGWTYHHNDKDYDRKDIVGWGFSQGDRIQIQVTFGQKRQIRFKKIGKFFDSEFTMPLGQKDATILNNLKPCVSFDAEEGAIVRIENFQVGEEQDEDVLNYG